MRRVQSTMRPNLLAGTLARWNLEKIENSSEVQLFERSNLRQLELEDRFLIIALPHNGDIGGLLLLEEFMVIDIFIENIFPQKYTDYQKATSF